MESYTITISAEDVNLIGQALGELPYKVSAGVLQRLSAALQASQQKPVGGEGETKENDVSNS